MEFSFAKEPGIILIKHLSSLIPSGADMYVYFAAEGPRLFKADYKASALDVSEIIDDEELSKAIDIRKAKKIQYNWELLPEILHTATLSGQRNIQFSISNEDDHLVLSMRFNSIYDKENDVVLVFFRPDLGIFGIEAGRISLNTDNKTLIANILYKSCVSVLSQATEDLAAFRDFTHKTKTAIDSVKVYKEKLKQLSDEHHKNTIVLAQNFISGLSAKYGKSFIFTDECIESLKNFSSDLPRLQSIVENAAVYAYNLNSSVSGQLLTIEEEYLEFSDSDLHNQDKESLNRKRNVNSDETFRTEVFLNKVENAVKRCLANKEKPIGNNVAQYMEPAVTSAAITLYMKKYSDTINGILDADSTKFSQARKCFKPLQNVIVSSKLAQHTG